MLKQVLGRSDVAHERFVPNRALVETHAVRYGLPRK
jgi:hypothetical protein